MAKDVGRANQLSEYFGVTPRLLPHVADLLADFTEIGSDPNFVVSWLVGKDVGTATSSGPWLSVSVRSGGAFGRAVR